MVDDSRNGNAVGTAGDRRPEKLIAALGTQLGPKIATTVPTFDCLELYEFRTVGAFFHVAGFQDLPFDDWFISRHDQRQEKDSVLSNFRIQLLLAVLAFDNQGMDLGVAHIRCSVSRWAAPNCLARFS